MGEPLISVRLRSVTKGSMELRYAYPALPGHCQDDAPLEAGRGHGGAVTPEVVMLMVVSGKALDVTSLLREFWAGPRRPPSERPVGDALDDLAQALLASTQTPCGADCWNCDAAGNCPYPAPGAGDSVPQPASVLIATRRIGLLATLLPVLTTRSGIRTAGAPILDATALLPALLEHRPDVLLLDWPFVAALGRHVLRQVHRQLPGLRVLLMCERPSAALVDCMLDHRFHGYLLDAQLPTAGPRAIDAVRRGELWMPRAVLLQALRERANVDRPEPVRSDADCVAGSESPHALTPREAEIVAHLRQGCTNKEIARRLGIMEDTVKKHLQSVFGKLGVRRRSQVALHGVSRGARGATALV